VTCKECRFYDKYIHLSKRGTCCRYPPVPTGRDYEGDLETEWPIVHEDDWCGEFVSKDAPEAKALETHRALCTRCGKFTIQYGGLCSFCDTNKA
jgi:hypothetical protein